jgi:hypothetical protein
MRKEKSVTWYRFLPSTVHTSNLVLELDRAQRIRYHPRLLVSLVILSLNFCRESKGRLYFEWELQCLLTKGLGHLVLVSAQSKGLISLKSDVLPLKLTHSV